MAIRVTGDFCWSMKFTLGFSPKAIFMAAGSLTIKSSMRRPLVLRKTNCPPTTLELPGPAIMEVIPARTASSKAASMVFMASRALSHGVTGDTFSLQSSPSMPFFSSPFATGLR